MNVNRMKWIRLYVEEIFYGTTFEELNLEERGVWFSLLVMAGMPPNPGLVEMRSGKGYTVEMLADVLNCDVKRLKKALDKLKKVGKIEILDKNVIKITNWKSYQTEYQRYKKKSVGHISNDNSLDIYPKENIGHISNQDMLDNHPRVELEEDIYIYNNIYAPKSGVSSNGIENQKDKEKNKAKKKKIGYMSNNTPLDICPKDEKEAVKLWTKYFIFRQKEKTGEDFPQNFGRMGKCFKDVIKAMGKNRGLEELDKIVKMSMDLFFEDDRYEDRAWKFSIYQNLIQDLMYQALKKLKRKQDIEKERKRLEELERKIKEETEMEKRKRMEELKNEKSG